MKARHLLMSAWATAAVLTAAGAPLAQAAPNPPEWNSEAPSPAWAGESFSFGKDSMRHTTTHSGFRADGTAYFTKEEIRFSPDGISFSGISSHS
ncbi:hypothetical protein ABZV77_23940 [Streptomyces sp. NPDC004732]|uniref:hypothetical protein n=1 Tax=Streptomyces sp. NPDC004732 TaxID=3154290 RepID=UPI0033ADD1BB